eukprot:TRINITY_DN11663_c0_g1_i1.p1 TRINITY_DN11663_c0_g1~~TRINITY_DN11663_c0_g1_i1.p1  ORF type:complete len:149 (-),score=53.08 TRINITY_DN11663_c0_g1_i1:52-498(-)
MESWRVDPLAYFKRFDVNSDGKLSAEELMPALQSLGFDPTQEDVKKLMDAADNDGDGMIEYESEEFVALLDELDDEPLDKVLEAFKFLDKNGDGQISADELRQLVTKFGTPMSEADADKLIAIADQNGDGVIDYAEFVEMQNMSTVLI